MSIILHIETATRVCSVGISRDLEILSLFEDTDQQYSHSSQLTGFIDQAVQQSGLNFDDLDAVAVSKGPGSYTGLRIGVSSAKGICYALNIPLIAVNTLEAMTRVAISQSHESFDFLVPMIDARRMEVYNAVFDADLNELRPVSAEIIDPNSLSEYSGNGRVAFFGDGAAKCSEVLHRSNMHLIEGVQPSITGMVENALKQYKSQNFENLAYFEPYYLKDFVAGKPKVKGLYS